MFSTDFAHPENYRDLGPQSRPFLEKSPLMCSGLMGPRCAILKFWRHFCSKWPKDQLKGPNQSKVILIDISFFLFPDRRLGSWYYSLHSFMWFSTICISRQSTRTIIWCNPIRNLRVSRTILEWHWRRCSWFDCKYVTIRSRSSFLQWRYFGSSLDCGSRKWLQLNLKLLFIFYDLRTVFFFLLLVVVFFFFWF